MKSSIPEITKIRKRTGYYDQNTRKPSMVKRLARLIVLGFFLILVSWYLNNGNPFIISSVQIETDSDLTPAQIDQMFQSNDLIGMNVFFLPLDAIQQNYLSCSQISSVSFRKWNLGTLKIELESAKPSAALARPWGYYLVNENGKFIRTIPPYAQIDYPVKLASDELIFNESSAALNIPWKERLNVDKISDADLIKTLGYRDLLKLNILLKSDPTIPEVQYIGYDNDYGIVLKYKSHPLILLGYGKDLELHYSWAKKTIFDSKFPYDEQYYIDLRFDKLHFARNIDNLPPLFKS